MSCWQSLRVNLGCLSATPGLKRTIFVLLWLGGEVGSPPHNDGIDFQSFPLDLIAFINDTCPLCREIKFRVISGVLGF